MPRNLEIFFACGGGLGNVCENALGESTEIFDATVTNDAGAPESGILVKFTIDASTNSPNASDDDSVIDPVECRTDAQGKCRTTATNPNPQSGDFITVAAAVAGRERSVQASVTTGWVGE